MATVFWVQSIAMLMSSTNTGYTFLSRHRLNRSLHSHFNSSISHKGNTMCGATVLTECGWWAGQFNLICWFPVTTNAHMNRLVQHIITSFKQMMGSILFIRHLLTPAYSKHRVVEVLGWVALCHSDVFRRTNNCNSYSQSKTILI